MSVRLQVLLDEPEYRQVQKAARLRRMTVAEWVRQALRQARRSEPTVDVERRLAAIRSAVKYEFPSGDITTMLEEIESGYAGRE